MNEETSSSSHPVVTRMSVASSTAKGWLLPVVTATYGYALTKHEGVIALLGIMAVALFAFLDANYLRQEKAYRALYVTVANKRRPVPAFTLDPTEADDPPPEAPTPRKVIAAIESWVPGRSVWLSWSIGPFYGSLLLRGLVIAVRS
jgi:histidine triad (HIT) family protein